MRSLVRGMGGTGRAVLVAAALGGAGCTQIVPAGEEAASRSAVVAGVLPYYAEGSFTPHWFASRAEVPGDFHAIRPFSLLDQRGEVLTESAFEGRVYVANFFFSDCPGICPMTMASMARLQEATADDPDVVLLSHSVTPETDSVAKLDTFARSISALAPKWFLATGDAQTIYDLGKNFYFADDDLGEVEQLVADGRVETFLHSESFFLVDSDRRIRGIYNGMNRSAVDQLIADIRTLQAEEAG